MPTGEAKSLAPIPDDPARYPETFAYGASSKELRIGDGVITTVNWLTPKPAVESVSDGWMHGDESEHFVICVACGQAFDMRRLGDVLHDTKPGHLPLSLDG